MIKCASIISVFYCADSVLLRCGQVEQTVECSLSECNVHCGSVSKYNVLSQLKVFINYVISGV